LIKVKVTGSFKHVEDFGARMKRYEQFRSLIKYGPLGVQVLKSSTPIKKGETANSWYYQIVDKPGYFAIHWLNSHLVNMVPVVILLQYGYGTHTGGYVQGRDFINPAMQPIFDQMVAEMWKVVTR